MLPSLIDEQVGLRNDGVIRKRSYRLTHIILLIDSCLNLIRELTTCVIGKRMGLDDPHYNRKHRSKSQLSL